MNNIAVIPARGNSKRIPKKNIRDFLGKPIIAYAIETALRSGLFQKVIVSTDNDDIAKVAKKYGAEVPFLRSEENSNDFATLADVIDEVKASLEQNNDTYTNICCILPTSPLLTDETLKQGYDKLKSSGADTVKPIVRFPYPIQRAIKMDNGELSMFNPEYINTRSQDLEVAYHDAGQFYWMHWKSGLRGERKFGFEIPESQVQDIDTLEDWTMAELKYKHLNNL